MKRALLMTGLLAACCLVPSASSAGPAEDMAMVSCPQLVRPRLALSGDRVELRSMEACRAASMLQDRMGEPLPSAIDGMMSIYTQPGFMGSPEQAVSIAASFVAFSRAVGEPGLSWYWMDLAFQSPDRTMRWLGDRYHIVGFSYTTARNIELLAMGGDHAGAFNLFLATLNKALQ